VKVELSREEVGQALVEFAARKEGLIGTFKHSIQINGSWIVLGDGAPVVVTLEPLYVSEGGST
jgi:hypothetical protein